MIKTVMAASVMTLAAISAQAEPLKLTAEQMDGITAGKGPYQALSANGNPVFLPTGPGGSLQNKNNPDLRFGAGGAISIHGDATADNGVVIDRGTNTDIVRPRGFN